ncbi:hypothetical protein [Streptomyces sp. NPDC048248]|uniref:hypothetical protein n=1 Tax=Streptomyces sp. NPDC048248 TaxID=3365523 RepID=UPI00371FFA13
MFDAAASEVDNRLERLEHQLDAFTSYEPLEALNAVATLAHGTGRFGREPH